MKKEKIKGNVFNDDEFGDYMIYTVWPEYRVFIDGRSDMYAGTGRLDDYVKVIGIQPGWYEVFQKYDVQWILCRGCMTVAARSRNGVQNPTQAVLADCSSRRFAMFPEFLSAFILT